VGLAAAVAVAVAGYAMPLPKLVATITYGAAFGLFPIGWVVFSAILLYRIILETGKFDILKDSIGHLTDDPKLQALLIAFAFGAFVEGAAGFGTPVAVAAAMLTGLGFTPFYAAAICLLANTAPVAFGSIGIPITTLAVTTGLPVDRLSAGVGRICAPVSLIVPAYLILVMSGWKGLRAVLPAAAACGIAFAGTQFLVSNFVGPELTDISASLAAMGALLLFMRGQKRGATPHSARVIASAWGPYILLVVFVLLWGYKPLQTRLDSFSLIFHWPGLPNAQPYKFPWLSASGTACLLAAILSAIVTGLKPGQFLRAVGHTGKQLALAELTLATVLALAFTMNYSGATRTLGESFAATGRMFPFFSALLGWLGVFLTGSDTSANALFGTLQVVTAGKLGMNPVLMAASNSAGGVMGKMISLTSIAVAAAATSMKRTDEALLFRFTLKHSVLLASVIGLLVVFYSYVAPFWAP
jgi:L-lactate transport